MSRAVAVDWSGAKVGAHRHIYAAEAEAGRLHHLRGGLGREGVAEWLMARAETDPDLVVGLDFAFSFPVWFLDQLGVDGGPDLWELVASRGEGWLATCPSPFWGRPGVSRHAVQAPLRAAEQRVGAKSVFQIGGAGSVGTGSLRGMPMLLRLREAGFSIWPFDAPRRPTVVEIYPRLLTGPVVKSRPDARAAYLHQRGLDIPEAVASEDAFDAAISALEMSRRAIRLPQLDPVARREGAIWPSCP